MTDFPESHRYLLDAQVATLATIGAGGLPQLTEIWFLHDEGELKLRVGVKYNTDLSVHDGPGDSRVVVTIEPENVYAVDMSG